MRKWTRFAPPSLHIFSTSSSEGVAEVLGKPPGTWSGESSCCCCCGGLEASPTVCRQREALSISWSCSTGCCRSPYMLPGHTGALCSRWGRVGGLTTGCCVFWQRKAGPGHCSAEGGVGWFLAGEGVLSASAGTTGDGVQGGVCQGSSSGARVVASCFWSSHCTGQCRKPWSCSASSSLSESLGVFPSRLVDGLGITLPKGLSRSVLPIGNGCGRRREGVGQARGKWQLLLVSS